MSGVAVVFGGPSPEHDISVLTGLQVERILSGGGQPVTPIYWTKSGDWLLVPEGLEPSAFLEPQVRGASELELSVPDGFRVARRFKSAPLDIRIVINTCHGGPGEDGTLTGLLSLAGYRVTGPSHGVCADAMDKVAMTAIAALAGIDVIPTEIVPSVADHVTVQPPWVVKPRFGGSSLGVHADVADFDTVKALSSSGVARSGAILQPYLEGWIDLNVSVRTFPTLEVTEVERPLRSSAGIYDYSSKYLAGGDGMESAPRELPARIPDETRDRVQAYAKRLAIAAGVTGVPRMDFLWDGDEQLRFCEMNSIPGAMGLYLWSASGYERQDVLTSLIEEAEAGPPRPHQWSAVSDGAALRVAGTVASKIS